MKLSRIAPGSAGILPAAVLIALAALSGCAPKETPQPTVVEETFRGPQLAGYADMTIPADNKMTAAKVELGRQLYYDKRLSGDASRACYSCHVKEKGLTDGLPTAIGAYEAKLTRASPTMWNVGYHKEWYWDGRAKTLEGQAVAALRGGNMGNSGKEGRPSLEDTAGKLNQIQAYRDQFQKVFGGPATPDNIGKALAAFMRTIVSDKSAWVRFRSGDQAALSEEAKRGWQIFSEKTKCTNCHDGLLLTDLQYHNTGIGMDKPKPDVGRFTVTKVEKDTGAFKTPTLIDINKSAPYFHDGSAKTLEQAVDQMLGGGKKNKYLDAENLKPVKLTKAERADLLAFLRSLDADYKIEEPKLP